MSATKPVFVDPNTFKGNYLHELIYMGASSFLLLPDEGFFVVVN